MILFFLFSLMSFFKINDSGTFYLALFSIFGGLWMTSDRILTLLFFNDPVFNLNICYMSMYLLPVPFLLYIKSICRLKRNRLLDLLSWLFLLFALSSAIMQLLNIIDFTTVLPVFHLMSLATAVCVCTIFYKETKKGKKPPVIFMISCVALFSFLLLDLVLFYASYIYKIDYFGYFQISMLLFIVINIGNLGENLFLIRDMNIKNRLLLSLAYTDTLTRLKNRTSFDEMMNAINNRLKQESSVHLIILDINNLKTINDTYGHKRGDDILVESAKILKATIGQLGDVYRIGGDEFACIIRNTDESVINEYVSEMFEQVDSFNSKNEQPKLSIAYGMATYHPELDKDIHSLFVRADKAMYNNKETQKVIQVVV
jgi:diguanylate cyclase (GGDEF)-like protein